MYLTFKQRRSNYYKEKSKSLFRLTPQRHFAEKDHNIQINNEKMI